MENGVTEAEDFREVLETKRVELIAGLHLERTFLFDYLRSKSVFDGGDCELICAEKTREQKAGQFLDILSTKGEEGYTHFIDAVQLFNPSLYEQITGEKANSKSNPIMTVIKKTSFYGKTNHCADLDIMNSQLQRTIYDLNDLTLRYQKVVNEKSEIEKRFIESQSDLEVQSKRVEQLEREKSETASDVISSISMKNSAKESVVHQIQDKERDLQERNVYIIALQMKLLAQQEKLDIMKNQFCEVEEAKQDLHNQLSLVTINYDHQRRESVKLSERLEFQKNDLQRYNEIRLKIREFQFINQKLKTERDDAVDELNSLKEWIEVFKARYDIVEKDSEQTRESHEIIAADCYNLRERIDELELKLRAQTRELVSTKQRYNDSEEAVKQLKEQRDLLSDSRKDLMLERDQALAECDKTIQRYTEVLRQRDNTITKQTSHCKHFEDKYDKTCAELQELQEKLANTENDLEDMRKTKIKAVTSVDADPQPQEKILGIEDVVEREFEIDETSDVSSPASQESDDSFDWKVYRKTTKIIESLKKRIGKGERRDEPFAPIAASLFDSKSLDRVLEQLVPQKKTLSTEAQQSLSLDRNKNVFKMTPTHSSLAFMFDSIASCTASAPTCGESRVSGDHKETQRCLTRAQSVLSDSEIDHVTSTTKTGKCALDTRPETLPRCNAAPKKPPYFTSLSSPSGFGSRLAFKSKSYSNWFDENCDEDANEDSKSFTFGDRAISAAADSAPSSNGNVDQALLSPSLKLPFRQRAMAIKIKNDERPRSSSAPPSSPLEAVSPGSSTGEADR